MEILFPKKKTNVQKFNVLLSFVHSIAIAITSLSLCNIVSLSLDPSTKRIKLYLFFFIISNIFPYNINKSFFALLLWVVCFFVCRLLLWALFFLCHCYGLMGARKKNLVLYIYINLYFVFYITYKFLLYIFCVLKLQWNGPLIF